MVLRKSILSRYRFADADSLGIARRRLGIARLGGIGLGIMIARLNLARSRSKLGLLVKARCGTKSRLGGPACHSVAPARADDSETRHRLGMARAVLTP